MSRAGEDDRAAVDRAFADLIAGYHLTADRPDPSSGARPAQHPSPAQPVLPTGQDQPSEVTPGTAAETETAAWADATPLFRYEEPAEPDETPAVEQFAPEPLMPLPRPAWPVLVAWVAMGYGVLAVLAAAMGVDLPTWLGWAAVIGFVGGFALLVTRLPRHRPPDAGDGAVV